MTAHTETAAAQEEYRPAPYTSRFVEANGLKLHVLDYGAVGKPAMLCVHGGAANGHWFDFVAPQLTADYHVLAIDLRGHGDSQRIDPPAYRYENYAADIEVVAGKLALEEFVLVGHSMGGTVALVYASTYPRRVKRLIVVDSSMNLATDRINMLRGVGNREGSSYATQDELVAKYRLRPGTSAPPAAILHHIARVGSRQFPDGAWRHKFDRNVYATREPLNGILCWDRIKVPALVIKGDRSPRITPEVFAEVKSRAPHVELTEVVHSDHHVTLDNPSGFVQAVKAFLARHP